MRYAKGIKTDLLILTLLAIEKEYAQYDMRKRLKTTYRTVLRHLQPLEKNGLIRVCRREPSEKKGKERKIYSLTITGLIEILGYKSTFEMIDIVAENYSDMLPLVFGKWKFFTEENKRDMAIKRLVDATIFYHQYVPARLLVEWTSEPHLKRLEFLKKKPPDVEMISDIVNDFTRIFLAEPFVYNPLQAPRNSYPEDLRRELEEWFMTLRKDPDLKAFIDRTFRRREKHKKFELESFMSWKNWWEGEVT